jgi:hypothetical protein
MRIAVACDNRRWKSPSEPFRHVAEGLRRLGHEVQPVAPDGDWPLVAVPPDAMFLWNGVHGRWGLIAERCRRDGIPTFIMERGFFDRFRHTQIDRQGFNHTASWAADVRQPAPPEGPERFAQVWGRKPKRIRRRKSGCVLVLCQVPGDAQLRDSEIRHPGPFVQAVEDAAPPGVEIRVRAHPLSAWTCGTSRRSRMTQAAALDKALAAAAFAVTINSNAGNEALAWGCCVLCLGPALYAMAGVSMQTELCHLPEFMQLMLDGWRPAQGDVENYLHHLACRQWSCEELARGSVLERLLADANAATA